MLSLDPANQRDLFPILVRPAQVIVPVARGFIATALLSVVLAVEEVALFIDRATELHPAEVEGRFGSKVYHHKGWTVAEVLLGLSPACGLGSVIQDAF